MTREEFEKEYAERSDVTLDWLRAHDQVAVPCDCDKEGCQGWQMVTQSKPLITPGAEPGRPALDHIVFDRGAGQMPYVPHGCTTTVQEHQGAMAVFLEVPCKQSMVLSPEEAERIAESLTKSAKECRTMARIRAHTRRDA